MTLAAISESRRRSRWGGIVGASLLAAITVMPPIADASIQDPPIGFTETSILRQRIPVFQPEQPTSDNTLISLDIVFEMNPGAEGVLIVGGDESEQFVLYVKAGRLVWTYQSVFQQQPDRILSDELPIGWVTVHYEFDQEQSVEQGRHRNGTMFVNGQFVGRTPDEECSTASSPQPGSQGHSRAQIEELTPEFSFTGRIGGITFSRRIVP